MNFWDFLYRFLWCFILFSFLGWCLEVIYAAVKTHRFINRGFNRGPVCPIYGCGVTLVYFVLGRLGKIPLWMLFLTSLFLVAGVELSVGFLMDKLFHHKWWDYSKRKLNIGGYICLLFSCIWGVICTFTVKLVFPLFNWFTDWIPKPVAIPLLSIFYILLLADTAFSVMTAAGFSRNMRALAKMAEALKIGSDKIGEQLYKGTVKIYDGTEKLRTEYRILADKTVRLGQRLLDAFPSMSASDDNEQILTLRSLLADMRRKNKLRNMQNKNAKTERSHSMIANRMQFLIPGVARYQGEAERYVRFTEDKQLLDENLWKEFVEVFRHDCDDADHGWRCEYFGKMMRGAVLTYMYNGNEKLYTVMKNAVEDLLTTQREDGRFSTYSKEAMLHGWDIWGRKYVLTSLIHFYKICREEALKKKILSALCRHADALLATVGPESEGKKEICFASDHWMGVNSASILDAVVDLYKLTGEKRYFDFASYIISTGGIQGEENLIEIALKGEKMPYEYPEVKGYETMSFFEGVLSYYTLTGEKKYLDAVLKFTEAVNETDITQIGCSGCTHELFDHSVVKQIEYSDIIMQETCVTVTWMRLLTKLYLLTGEKKYADRVEFSTLNALYGAANVHMQKSKNAWQNTDEWFDALPFDSYSPLYNNKRGAGVGGKRNLMNGSFYGCCACIASAGIALYPLDAAVTDGKTLYVNYFLPGEAEFRLGSKKVKWTAETAYPAAMQWKSTINVNNSTDLRIYIRLPEFVKNPKLLINGEVYEAKNAGGYLAVERTFENGDTVELLGEYGLELVKIGDRSAFAYGPLTLARDEAKEEGSVDLTEELTLALKDGKPVYRLADAEEGEMLRLYVKLANGGELLLTDYASCGKKWMDPKNRITVWMNIE